MMTRAINFKGSGDGAAKATDRFRGTLDAAKLRRIAEGRAALKPLPVPDGSAEVHALVHELQVNQIELELQNEALQARLAVEERLARGTDHHELAPVAYLTLGRDGTIRQLNAAASGLIGLPLDRLSRQRMESYVSAECRPAFGAFLERVFARPVKQACEITLVREGRPDLEVRIEAIGDGQGQLCRLGATDITERKRTEQALRDSEERLRLALLAANDGWWDWQLATGQLYLSPCWLAMLGYAAGELTTDAALRSRMMHPDDRARTERTLREALDGDSDHYQVEFRLRHKDGHFVSVLSRGYITRDERGRPVRVSGTDSDLTGKRQLDQERRLAQMVFASTDEGIVVTDTEGVILEVNPAYEMITGYARSEVLGHSSREFQADIQDEAFWQALWRTLAECGQWRGELRKRRKNGEVYPEWLTVSAVRDAHGRTTHYVGVFSDISKAKAAQEKIDFLAHHDALTHLPNRVLLRERLEHGIVRARRHDGRLAVLFLDIDRFKNVNDALGHPVGDTLLREVARRMEAVIRAEDTLARLGADEFVLLLEDNPSLEEIEAVARKLLAALAAPAVVDGQALSVTVSIGASVYPDHGKDADTLLQHADQAMYQAKKNGRNRFHLFHQELSGEARQRLVMENALRSAIERHELVLHLQPQVDLCRHRLAGVEALVRWRHPTLGMIWPAKFIPLAEEIGFIGEIDRWVLVEACRQMARWQAQGIHIPYVAVNLSAQQIEGDYLRGAVAAALEATGLRPQQLELEVTESMIMRRPEEARRVLGELRELGVKTAVDDFGTGYSSLAYLKRLPLDRLKIDKSFVRDIGRDRGDEAITRAVIRLAASLGLETIAEGVECGAQLQFLQEEGCAVAQGFHFSPPLPPEQLITLLRQRDFLPPAGRA